jgi:hypothetical protein
MLALEKGHVNRCESGFAHESAGRYTYPHRMNILSICDLPLGFVGYKRGEERWRGELAPTTEKASGIKVMAELHSRGVSPARRLL